jgi:1-phosphofructokinase family hexose kinase
VIYTVTLNPAVDRELTVPKLEFDSVLRATAWQVDCGGKGFNVSRMLMSLGQSSVALGFAGGRSGELLLDGLDALGIETDFIWVAGETRTNVSIVSQSHDHYIKANEPGPTICADDQARLLAQVQTLAQSGDWWVLAGSLPPGVPATIYAEMLAILNEAGAKAILDTSGEALQFGCAGRPFLAKPNETELSKLTGLPVGNEGELVTAVRAMQAMGVVNVVVSLGKAGALLADGAEIVMVASPKIDEQNPIGAGDSMVGGLVWGLSQGHTVAEALRWGIACGAATASMSGTAVGSRELVKELWPQVGSKLVEIRD